MNGQSEFDALLSKIKNPYLATNIVSKSARRLGEQCKIPIRDSKLITWAITGKEPKDSSYEINKIRRKLQRPEDILNYISDTRIVKSVSISLGMSKSQGHLIYRYIKGLDQFEKSKVRILIRMIWYSKYREDSVWTPKQTKQIKT